MRDIPIDDYDELTVPEVKERCQALEMADLVRVHAYEANNDDRVTLLDWLEDRIDEDPSPNFVGETTVDAEVVSEPEPEPDDVDVTDEDATGDHEGPETVLLQAPTRGNFGGVWFDGAQDVKRVEKTTRIERAIERGYVDVLER